MLLIDALNIRQGGGKVLLDYLLKELDEKNVDYRVIKHDQNAAKKEETQIVRSTYLKYLSRHKIVDRFIRETSADKLLCFGNFPPVKKYPELQTTTYFQNSLLLESSDISYFGFKSRCLLKLRRLYLRAKLKNTDRFFVQTKTVERKLTTLFGLDSSQCMVLPFFDEKRILEVKERNPNQSNLLSGQFIYPSSPQPHKNHLRLLEAWRKLLSIGHDPVLYLTIPADTNGRKIIGLIKELNDKGAKIKNLSVIPNNELLEWILKCEYMIYPSLEETLGISLIEGVHLDCKVLVSEREYCENIVEPSATFNPEQPESICAAVMKTYERELPCSRLRIENKIDRLINELI